MTNGWRATISLALVLSAGSLFVSGLVFKHANSQDSDITGNRVEQTRQGCRERNVERFLLRRKFAAPLIENLRTQRAQTREVPDAALEQFGVTKREAIDSLNGSIRGFKKAKQALHPLDCKARVRDVRDTLH